MPIWGIVLLAVVGWAILSLCLALIIGRAVRRADIEQADRTFVYQLGKMPEPIRDRVQAAKTVTR